MDVLVSVIMPVYNSSRFLSRSIESVLKQTYQKFELIIIDDKSTDDSLSISEKYAKEETRIRVIALPFNQGVAQARNRGISEAKGDYIALLDSDDVWLPEKLERQLLLLEKQGASLAYCSYDFIDENDFQIMKPFIVGAETDFKKMLYKSVISCSTAVIDAELMKSYPFESEYYHEDYALWMKLLSIPVNAVGIPDVLTHYRRVSGSRSDNKRRSAKERWKVYRMVLNMGLFESAVAFSMYAVCSLVKYYRR